MNRIIRDKFVAEIDEPVVLFLVGGHSNKVLAVQHWFWMGWSLLHMARYVTTHPETGCLGGHVLFRLFPFGLVFQSYWRSFDDLENFARAKDESHLKAWQRFMQQTAQSHAVALWHETYLVEPGKVEAVYGSSVPYGLAAVSRITLPTGRKHNARGRFNPQDESVSEEPLVPLPPA